MQNNNWRKGLVLVAVFGISLAVIQPVSEKLFGLSVASQLGSIGIAFAIALAAISPKTIKKTSGKIIAAIKSKLTIPHPRPVH